MKQLPAYYLVFVLPGVVPPPIEPPVLGDVVLGEVVLDEPPVEVPELELPLPLIPEDVPPDAPVELEPDLLKWASHSAREICPSLLVSTAEKLGAEVLLDDAPAEPVLDEPPAEALPEELLSEGLLEEPLAAGLLEEPEALPDADGEDSVADGEDAAGDDEEGLLDDEEEDCATASVDSANSTAAVVMLRALGMDETSCGWGKLHPCRVQAACPKPVIKRPLTAYRRRRFPK